MAAIFAMFCVPTAKWSNTSCDDVHRHRQAYEYAPVTGAHIKRIRCLQTIRSTRWLLSFCNQN